MNPLTFNPADMVQIQFRKAMKRGLLNVRLMPVVSHPALPPEDNVVAEVTDRAAQIILFTNTGLTVPGHGFVRYEQVQSVAWIAFGPDRLKRMREGKDRLELRLDNGLILALTVLDQAYAPMLRFFQLMLARRNSSPRGVAELD